MGFMKWARAEWDRVGAGVAVAIGALALLIGYLRTADTPHLAEQIPLVISGGLGGIFLLSIGAVLWLSADMRDEWRELRVIREGLLEVQSTLAAGSRPPSSPIAAWPDAEVPPSSNGTNALTSRSPRRAKASS